MYDWAEFRHFRYLLKILEMGFRPAAEQLHTSQPNLTVQARQFQEYASVCLYKKSKDGRIQPTETGRAFIALAKLLLEVRDEVIDALISIDHGEVQTIRLGCSPLANPEAFRTLCGMHKEVLPSCAIRPTHADTVQLAQEVVSGKVDAAIITLPLKHPQLRIEELKQDRLVVCMRRDDLLAPRAILQVSDLQGRIAVLYHPQRHPEAHMRLVELLNEAGVRLEEYCCASHPSEMQALVKEGYGLALIREGTILDEDLITRRILGVDWTVDTAIIFHAERHTKTIPVLTRRLRKSMQRDRNGHTKHTASVHLIEPHHTERPHDVVQLSLGL